MPSRSGVVEVNRASLWYEVAGSGAPVILIHGNLVDASWWDDQFQALAADFRVFRYDLRGYGRSTMPDEPYAHHEDVLGLMDALELPSAHLVGASLGAAVALDVALTAPRRVESMVLVPGGFPGIEWSDELAASFAPLTDALAAGNLDAARDAIWSATPMLPAARSPEVRRRLDPMFTSYSWRHFVEGAPEQRWVDPPSGSRLAEVQAPTLVIVGDNEVPDFQRLADLVQQQMPNAERVTVPGASHVVNFERPDAFNSATRDFIRRHATIGADDAGRADA